jgi:hypothetical protein
MQTLHRIAWCKQHGGRQGSLVILGDNPSALLPVTLAEVGKMCGPECSGARSLKLTPIVLPRLKSLHDDKAHGKCLGCDEPDLTVGASIQLVAVTSIASRRLLGSGNMSPSALVLLPRCYAFATADLFWVCQPSDRARHLASRLMHFPSPVIYCCTRLHCQVFLPTCR